MGILLHSNYMTSEQFKLIQITDENIAAGFTLAEFLPGSPGTLKTMRDGNTKQIRLPMVAPVKPNITSTAKEKAIKINVMRF